jgi:hypothetical protein
MGQLDKFDEATRTLLERAREKVFRRVMQDNPDRDALATLKKIEDSLAALANGGQRDVDQLARYAEYTTLYPKADSPAKRH